jgi:hypothetical protein
MIEFTNESDYLKCGLDFTDIFEQEVFRYLIQRDGKMYYDPVKSFMCDITGAPVFYVEQEFHNKLEF